MGSGSFSEEGFLDFCDYLANDNGFFAKVRRRNAAKKEWRTLDETMKRGVMGVSRAISASQQAADSARKTVRSSYDTIARLPKTSGLRRLKHLDRAETAMMESVEACKFAMRGVDTLLKEMQMPSTKGDPILLPLLESWRSQATTFLAREKHSLVNLQLRLHGLKRRTPGRKVVRGPLPEEMETLSKRRVERPPRIMNPPPKRRITPATGWHCRDLGTSKGAINKGVHVLIGTNSSGRIVDRTVRKTVVVENCWDWCEGLPREHVTHAAVSGLEEARFVLQIEEWPEAKGNNYYCLYFEFAPHGDLGELGNNHRQANQWVPEDFLWLLFQMLIESALLMKNGSLAGSGPADWQLIIHRDMKPENIVLGLPVKRHFQMYPRPKLTDFGGAIFTNEDDPANPDLYATFGTTGLIPPEQSWYVDPLNGKPVDRFPVLSPANVWAIGAIMYNMMTLELLNKWTQPSYSVPERADSPLAGPSRHYNPRAQTFEAMDIDGQTDLGYDTPDEDRPLSGGVLESDKFRYMLKHKAYRKYNAELCDMVNRCMNFDPADRPPIEDLMSWLEDQFKKRPRLRALESGRKIVRSTPEPALFKMEKDEYKLGMLWQTLRVTN